MTDDENKRIIPPVPRGEVCEKMCARCPFKPDGSGYAQDHPDLPNIIAVVEQGLPFYCHETVLFDERTQMLGDEPWPPVQAHFELCRGGHERRMAVWITRAAGSYGITEAEVKLRAGLIKASTPEPAPASLRRDVNTGRAWLYFATKPDKITRDALSAAGWRYSGYREEWNHPRKFIVPPASVPYTEDGTVAYSDERAERLAKRSGTARAEATQLFAHERQIGSGIPMGQPILVGHHSEKRHRRDIERIQKLAEKGVAASNEADRLTGAAGSSARLRERRQTDAGLTERRLVRLRLQLGRMESNLLRMENPDPDYVRRSHLLRAEIWRNEMLVTALHADAGAPVEVAVGDVIEIKKRPFLVGRVNHRTFSGWTVGGGADAWPGKLAKTHFEGVVLMHANKALLAAVAYRAKLGGFYGDVEWRKLIDKGLEK